MLSLISQQAKLNGLYKKSFLIHFIQFCKDDLRQQLRLFFLCVCFFLKIIFRCAKDLKCFACQYREGSCAIIHTCATQARTFVSNGNVKFTFCKARGVGIEKKNDGKCAVRIRSS